MATPTYLRQPVLAFFQEIKPGDVRKQQAVSNDASSGGGARDLRIRPAAEFARYLDPMFPNPGREAGVRIGKVHWIEDGDGVKTADIELWRPTDARPGEARIGRIYTIDAWTVNEDAYNTAQASGNKWFYLLVLDRSGTVWARILKAENLGSEDSWVSQYVKSRIQQTHKSRAVRGLMDFRTHEVYPA